MTWRKVKVSEFLTERSDRFSPDEANALGLRRVGKIDFSGKIHLVEDKSTRTGMILVKKGDLLISGINAEKGAVSIYDFDEDALATIHYSSYTYDARKINITFLKWFLKSPAFKGILNSNVGNGIKTEIKPKRFLALEMYLPELEEQGKIVNRIQAIEGEIVELQAFVNDNTSLLIALRQAILTEAVQGQLTAQWRKENPNQEHARELLQRIAVEKAKLIKEKKISKEKPLPSIEEDEVPFVVPEGWVWCRLGEVATHSLGKMLDQNKNKGIKRPYLRNINVRWFDFYLDDLKEMPFEEAEADKYTIQKGDLVLCEGGYPGRGAIWRSDETIMFQKALHRVRFIRDLVSADYFLYFLFLKDSDRSIEFYFTGAGIQHLTGNSLGKIEFPLPPLLEQHAIVQKINTLMAYCDELEQQVRQSKADLELLMQSVLSEVFGTENQAIGSKAAKTKLSGKEILMPNDTIQLIYEGNTLNMELLEILQQQGGKIAAVNLWKMSKYQKDIDAFYEALKKEVEEKKTIKESSEKGWLELVAP